MNIVDDLLKPIIETNNFDSLLSDLIVGILLVFIFFLYREKISPLPNISGKWYFRTTTEQTIYNPYKNMTIDYDAIILQNGQNIEGTIEKFFENSINGKKEYIGKDRIHATLRGYIERNYLGKDKIRVHITEKGEERESTSYYELKKECGDTLNGTFDSTAANSTGTTIWQRIIFA